MKKVILFQSPLGLIRLEADQGNLISLDFLDEGDSCEDEATPLLLKVKKELLEYFQGKRKKFTGSHLGSGTYFQRSVWKELKNIPYGQTCSYSEVAHRIKNEKGQRAVALANKRNPLPVLIPCHRVVNKDGSLGGFDCGLWRKKILLKIEGVMF